VKDYWFFLSYSRRDAIGSEYLKQFYEALANQVGKAAAVDSRLTVQDIGFLDTSDIETGNQWDETLREALQTSRTMVCLYSRSYFKSIYCGKEFRAFHTRLVEYASCKGIKVPPLILPVVWDLPLKLPRVLPSIVSAIQYTHDEFGRRYAEKGLDLLIKQEQKYKGDYEEFIVRFADRLVQVAEENDLSCSPSKPICLDEIESVFHVIEEPPQGRPVPPQLVNVGLDFAHFVYVAGQAEQVKEIRNHTTAYGERGGRFWRPYNPDPDTPIALLTARAALEMNLQHEVLVFNEGLIDRLRELDESNTMAVLVVDPWSLKIELYKRYLFAFDKGGRFLNCGVLIIWNEKDIELSLERREELEDSIRATFPNNMVLRDQCFRDAVLSESDMRTQLMDVLKTVKERIEQRMQYARPRPKDPTAGADMQIPTISPV
jgi:FxsC-like protein